MYDADFLDAAGGDRARARILHGLLQQVARHGTDERLREMAGEVLKGTVSLADAAASSYYGEAIRQQATGFADWYHGLSETERGEQERAAAAAVAAVREEIDREAAAARHTRE
ncbi:hypothetical protein [Actinoplanes sp. NPDC049316]|uniref:hypothetical protein n=1 Tax=Actinoplanes sp. NPDC049316 TaxID=3154727 RepID=UPI00343D224F